MRRGVGCDGDGECRLAHARPPGKDHQIRALQPAELVVEVDQAGGHAGHAAVLVVRRFDQGNGAGQDGREPAKTTFELAFLGQHEQPLLGRLDLLAAALRQGRIVRLVDQLLADMDQPALERQVVQQPTILLGIDDALGRAREPGKVLRPVQFPQGLVILERELQGYVIGEPPAFDEPRHCSEDSAMHWLVEMLRSQVLAHSMVRLVIDQNGPEQRLLGFDIMRLCAKTRRCAALPYHVGMRIHDHGGTISWRRHRVMR